MDDNTMPFSFPDCDAFLASLDSESQFGLTSDLDFNPQYNNSDNTITTANNNNIDNNNNFIATIPSNDDSFQFNQLFAKVGDLSVPSPTNTTSMSYNSNNLFLNPLENLDQNLTFNNNNNNNNNLRYSTSSTTSEGVSPDSMLSDSNSSFSHPSNLSPLSPPEISPGSHYTTEKFGSFSSVASNDYTDVKLEPVSPNTDQWQPLSRINSNSDSTSTTLPQSRLQLSLAVDPTHASTKGSKITKPKKEKSAHNMIERRYRTNINDKILALRDCVPSLQCLVTGVQPSDLDGLRPANKLNKATVLTKAAEYIIHLQRRNTALVKENELLRKRLYSLGGDNIVHEQKISSSSSVSPSSHSESSPEYSDEISAYRNVASAYPDRGGRSKMIMGSMAGVMATGLINDMAHNSNGNTYGMSAIPLPAVLFTNIPGTTLQVLQGLKLGLVLAAVVSIMFPVLFGNPEPAKKQGKEHIQEEQQQWDTENEAGELSVREQRRSVWQINSSHLSLDNTWSGSEFANLLSLGVQLIKVGASSLLGQARFYNMVSFISPDANHVKANGTKLTRAIDAQLCGGDSEPSTYRFLYTFLQSRLVPDSAARYMTQAVHIHVIFHEIPYLRWMAHGLASMYWRAAKRASADLNPKQPTRVALLDLDYNKVFDPDMVQRLNNLAYNRPLGEDCLSGIDDEGFNSVADDCNIQSPLDALGCWVAAQILHEVLTGALEGEVDFKQLDVCAAVAPCHTVVKRQIVIAESLFMGQNDPQYISRAMALIYEEMDFVTLSGAKSAISPVCYQSDSASTVVYQSDSASIHSDDDNEIDSDILDSESDIDTNSISSVSSHTSSTRSLSFPISRDSQIAIHSSIVLGYLATNDAQAAIPLLQRLQQACRRTMAISSSTTATGGPSQTRMGLLSFVALWITMAQFSERESNRERDWKLPQDQREVINEKVNGCLEDIAAAARVWIGGDQSELQGLSLRKRRQLADCCVEMGKKFGGFNVDGELFA